MTENWQLWDGVATAVERARRARELDVSEIACEAGLDHATVRRLLAAEPVRMSTLHLVLDAVGIKWDELLASLVEAN